MKQTKRAWFMPFRLPRTTDFEAWLEREAAEGYTPSKVGQLSSFCMTLVKGEPDKVCKVCKMLYHEAVANGKNIISKLYNFGNYSRENFIERTTMTALMMVLENI